MSILIAYAMGFSVASMPGPILALIVTETLRRGPWPGTQAAVAPICVDACIMLPLLIVLQSWISPGVGTVAIGLAGSMFLFWLGIQSCRTQPTYLTSTTHNNLEKMLPFLKCVLIHLMNPYAYIFWGTVGFAFVREGFEGGGFKGALTFPVGFWLGAGTMNFLVVYLVSRSRHFLLPRQKPYIHVFSGLLLIGAGITIVWGIFRDHI
jgi:threonine/homoserine/homoserine lactone efflux protein